MKKLIIILILSIGMSIQAQDKLTAFAEVTGYNFSEYNYTLDVYYKLSDTFAISSWNTITSGRNEAQGFNYSVKSLLFNWSSKKRNTLSIGYGEINQIQYNFNNKAFIVKLRVKLL